jgi:hypothetical protein
MPGIIKAWVAEQEKIIAAIQSEEPTTSIGDHGGNIDETAENEPQAFD